MKRKKLLKVLSMALVSATIIGVSPISASADWKQNSTGWWYTEGSSWATGWRNISGKWYFFDQNGYMKTGWLKDNGTWYYLSQDGDMKTGWIQDGDTWYYLNASGAMQTGWVKYLGDWYYLDSSGAMQVGREDINNIPYFFDYETGKQEKGFIKMNDFMRRIIYYYDENGNYKTGWFDVDGKTYYQNERGCTNGGIEKIDDKLYIFNYDGDLNKTEGLVNVQGRYDNYSPLAYGNGDGTAVVHWRSIDGKKYYFDEEGYAVSGVVDSCGKLYYFDLSTHELVCNENNYGISTDEGGQVVKVDADKAIKDIEINDSTNLSELKEKGEVSFKYFGIKALEDVISSRGSVSIKGKDAKFDESMMREPVFHIIADVKGHYEFIRHYYVSLKDGKILYYDSKSEFGGILYELKDNSFVKEYDVNIAIPIC